MKFEVARTSLWEDDESPCKEARKEECIRIDERMVNDPAKLGYITPEEWASQGTNHRVEKGHIKRDFPARAWFIELADLESLRAFWLEQGRLIIRETWRDTGELCIEIYDSYREEET